MEDKESVLFRIGKWKHSTCPSPKGYFLALKDNSFV